MAELKCPHCGQVFTVDDNELDSIVKQIRDKEFRHDVDERVEETVKHLTEKHAMELQNRENDVKLRTAESFEKEIRELNEKLLNAQGENRRLQIQLDSAAEKQNMAVMTALKPLEQENEKLKMTISGEKTRCELAVREAVDKVQDEKQDLQRILENEKEKHELIVKQKDQQIEFYKDLKTKMSTKMVGETLEQHCEVEFNKLRATAFQNAYFEKDNDARTGSKGDYIYRENDSAGNEIVSIMFEMKNENDETASKHKNEDFFKELDKDRREKNCEYAVLVSLLESDSDLYNAGIVDVSYKFEKMYVVRPQCFIPMITLLRNAAMNSLCYKQELAEVRNANIDITNFENRLTQFKDDFGRNYNLAHDHFEKAIDEIDKTIDHLQKVKKELQGSDNQLRLATNKVEDVSVKKLTKDNPTMKAKFEQLKNEQDT